jgi:hypothetical protein
VWSKYTDVSEVFTASIIRDIIEAYGLLRDNVTLYLIFIFILVTVSHYHHHHHHHWLDSPTWALVFLRSFCQLNYPAVASSDFVTKVFSTVELSAPRPIPGYPAGPMFSVRIVSLS